MWFILFAIFTFKLMCIFIFVIYCVVTFLLVMYNAQTEELRRCIVPQDTNLDVEFPTEVRTLQNQISNLSIRREALRSEVLKQQEDYQKMLSGFSKELESKKTLFCTLLRNILFCLKIDFNYFNLALSIYSFWYREIKTPSRELFQFTMKNFIDFSVYIIIIFNQMFAVLPFILKNKN
ncbi:uncharacterized protein LOC100646201 isoform X6 [Bombus terrestris]|uniref:Uncharacterized protein LOC100646201 isoform X6 n=1 Tax=Bombus terrestris TaxID=30195 RepID=A0A9C6SJD9_BOMTE|nr:uncharacterized protein LOC100646201 isoform X6 [Bombus terrestris]